MPGISAVKRSRRKPKKPSASTLRVAELRAKRLAAGLCQICGKRPRALRLRFRVQYLKGMRGPGLLPAGDDWQRAFITECDPCNRKKMGRSNVHYKPVRPALRAAVAVVCSVLAELTPAQQRRALLDAAAALGVEM